MSLNIGTQVSYWYAKLPNFPGWGSKSLLKRSLSQASHAKLLETILKNLISGTKIAKGLVYRPNHLFAHLTYLMAL